MKKTTLELIFPLTNCWGLHVAQLCQQQPSDKVKRLLKNYVWSFIPLPCLTLPPPNRQPIPWGSVTRAGGSTQGNQGKERVSLPGGKQRASILLYFLKSGLHCVRGRWSGAQIPGGVSALSSSYQLPPRWLDATGMSVAWPGPKDTHKRKQLASVCFNHYRGSRSEYRWPSDNMRNIWTWRLLHFWG